tara:strand:- start:2500 stop:4335 length:1836 start_codon:yes stop_codon:yes gene_type:complete
MGIERFFSTLYRNNNKKFFTDLTYPYQNNINIKNLFIDMNSIIHNQSSILLKQKLFNQTDIFENELINRIKEYINHLQKLTNSTFIYIAIDGVPSLPKINEQKNRRYISKIVEMLVNKIDPQSKSFTWSKDNISPYSLFMNKMVNQLKKNNNYEISSHFEKGEGEMKIIKYIIKNKIKNCVIYSPDSDMVLLLGLLDIKNSKYILLRNDNNKTIIENKIKYYYNYADIKEFHHYILDYLDVKIYDKSLVIKDIIFLFSLFGNDFLPKHECLRVNTDIKLFLEIYNFNLKENGHILNKDQTYVLNNRNFITFLELLNQQENMLLQRNQYEYKYFNFTKNMVNHFNFDIKNLIKNLKELTVKNFKKSTIYLRINLSNNPQFPFGFLKYKIIQTMDYHLFTDNILFDNDKQLLDKLFIFLINIKENSDKLNKIFLTEKFNDRWFYREITEYDFLSKNNKYHKKKLERLNFRDQLLYKIEYKLDNFYKIFNRTDNFYEHNLNKNNYYNLKSISKKDIETYLVGLMWILDYYMNLKDESEFIYTPIKSPLSKELIKRLHGNKLAKKKKGIISIEKQKQLISPNIRVLQKYLKTNFKGKIDCTSSIFTNKCHVLIFT